VSLLDDVSHHCFNRRVARPSKRGRKRDDIITAHDLNPAAIRRAEQQMQRNRDAVLRGDTYRVGGRHDAPTDRSSDVTRVHRGTQTPSARSGLKPRTTPHSGNVEDQTRLTHQL
jgi:hypothetical protein